jgi:hypothetical protein
VMMVSETMAATGAAVMTMMTSVQFLRSSVVDS